MTPSLVAWVTSRDNPVSFANCSRMVSSAAPPLSENPFAAQTVLVTGASAGIGKAFAEALAARGAQLVLCARNAERLEALAQALRSQYGATVRTASCDLERPGAARELRDQLVRDGVTVDILINNAGFGSAGRFHRQAAEHVATMTQLNCVALAELTHALLPAMIAKQRGGVINVASVAAFVPTPLMAIYGASKAYVLSFSAALNEELRGTRVHVMALCPGPVPTEFQKRAGYAALDLKNPAALSAEQVVEAALAAYARGQFSCVPGAVNRVQTALSGLLPLTWIASISARVLRGRGRDL
jgi:uncharacterized protein